MGTRAFGVVLSVAAVAVLPGTAFAETDTTPPTLTVSSGAFDGQYISPPLNGIYISLSTADDSGIRRIAVEEVGQGEVVGKSTCGSHGCPTSYSGNLTIPNSALAAGTHQFQYTATDAAGNVERSRIFPLIIDPTPPHASPGGVVATFDPSDNSVDVSWADATDPTLPDGTPGAVAGYTVQYSIGTGPYGYPIDTDGPSFSIPDQVEGEVVNVWVVTTDAAGRKSLERESNDANEFMTGSDTATRATMTPEAIGESDDGESGDADIPTVDTSDYGPDLDGGDGTAFRRTLDAPFPDLCADESPCGDRYNGHKAAHYAHTHYKPTDYNHKYPHFNDDCTNFISQAVHAGGMNFLRTNTNRVDATTDPTPLHPDPPDWGAHYAHGEGSWWAASAYSYRSPGPYPTEFDWARSWSVATTSHDHFLEYGLARRLLPSDAVRAGDVIYYAWDADDGQPWNHSSIVTRVTKHSIVVAQHGKDYEHTLHYVIYRSGGLQDQHPDYQLQFVRPTFTKANVPY